MPEVRLIDGNALAVSDMAKLIDQYLSDQCNLTVGLAAALMPEIEAEPVRHGRWIEQENPFGRHYNCSECGHEVSVPCSEMIDPRDYACYLDDYCGKCGARMDGALTMEEKEIPAGADLNDFPEIGVYKQKSGLEEAFQKALKESPHVLVIQEKPRWIPCSERLPENNVPVLYVWRSQNGAVAVLHGWHFEIRALGSAWHQSGVGMHRPEEEVTHWMPLPEPPEMER